MWVDFVCRRRISQAPSGCSGADLRCNSLSKLSLKTIALSVVLMAPWFWYAVVAAVLYGAHQIFTRLASDHIGDGLGGFVVEAVAALSILGYLAFLWFSGR